MSDEATKGRALAERGDDPCVVTGGDYLEESAAR